MAALIWFVKEPALLLPKYSPVAVPSSRTVVIESTTDGEASGGVKGGGSILPRLVESGPEEVVDLGVAFDRGAGGKGGCAKFDSGVRTTLDSALVRLPGLFSIACSIDSGFSDSEL